LNGYLVWRLSLSPLIVTLAGLTFYQGVINLISSGQGETDLSEGFTKYGQGAALFGLPNPVTIMIVIAVVAGFYLSKTSGGLNIYAVGGNVRAAGLAGVKTRRLVLCLFMVNVVIVGVAGLLNASRFGGAVPSQGVGLELSVITAVVLGGVSLTGGEGSILGTVLAAVLLTVVSSGIVVLAVNVYWSDIVRGLLLFAAVAIDQITKEQHERYRRAQAMKAAIGDGAGEA
jgi:ribose/xylose/arabinose/galactoside ABC-type transport system permease subunit